MTKSRQKNYSYSLDSSDLGHFFEELSAHDSFYFKKFFRGLSIYFSGKAVAYISDRPGDKFFRGKSYDIEIWNGCLIPTDREHHSELLRLIKGTVVHPVIKKWLYLPKTSDYFEDSMVQLVNMIKSENSLVGIEPDLKPKKARSTKSKLPSKKSNL